MNKVELEGTGPVRPKTGGIYQDPDDGELYLVSIVTPTAYVAIGLNHGINHNDLAPTEAAAVSGLTFVCNSAKITVEPLS